MPTYLCVECFQCSIFQVTQLCKTRRKFTCKVCHAKQSIRKVHTKSEQAKDVRHAVQLLNRARGEHQEQQVVKKVESYGENRGCSSPPKLISAELSKWSAFLPQQDDGSSDDSADDPCVVTSTPPRTYGKKRVRVRRQHDCGADAADDDHLSQQGKKLQRRARKPEHFTAGGHRVAPRVAKAAPAVARMSCNGRAAQLQQERVLQSQRENVIVDCGSDAVSRCGSGSGSTAGAEESSGFGTCADDEYDAIFASIPTSVFSAPCAATLVDVAPAQPGALPPYGGKRAASKPDSCQVAIGASASARAAHSRWGSIGAVEASPTVVQHSGMAHRLAQRSDVTGSSSGGESMCAARASAAGRWGKFGTAAAEVFSSDESDDEEEGGFVETGRDASAANLLFGS